MSALDFLILVVGGFGAGFINTVAGGGSAISIPILVELVGPNVANGTNRVAIMLANATAVAGFQRSGKVPWRTVAPLIPAAVIGAAAGALVATQLSASGMRRVFAVVLVLVALSVLIRPSRWVADNRSVAPLWARLAIFTALGFYGGFVQAGVGFLLLAGLVFGSGLDLVRGNGAKVLLILCYTPIALVQFALADQVDWLVGLVLAIGNSSGAWISARLAVKKGAGWIRWFLVAAALAAAARMILTS